MKIWSLGQISPEEKSDILSKHREIYNGYKTMLPQVSNTQPLYTQDYANDKNGLVVNNKGEVKQYTNMGINESIEEGSDEMCEQCGGMTMEGECSECGWKGEVGDMEEQYLPEDLWAQLHGKDYEKNKEEKGYVGSDMPGQEEMDMEVDDEVSSFDAEGNFLGAVKQNPDMEIEKPKFRPGVDLGKSFDKFKDMMEGEGKLSDIYNVEDLGDSDFDYVEGGGNDYGTFEKMHHMKGIKNEQNDDDFVDNFEDPDNEDDGFEDIQAGEELDEQGYTGGGNAPDFDISNIKPAYNFQSGGPGDVYPTESKLEEQFSDYDDEFETMESAWADDLEEANDISGVQGMYGDMKPAYDFDSKGPGSAGPYQRSSWGGLGKDDATDHEMEEQYLPKHIWKKAKRKQDAEKEGEEFDQSEFDITDYDDDIKDKSWEEITAMTGDDEFSNLDEDIKESFIQQKNKITEMFNRMKVIK